MTDLGDPAGWAAAFGLAEAPLFGDGEHGRAERHRVLLDGGAGTFMISVDDLPDPSTAASWAWSSDVVHHVGINADHVTVLRWDQQGPARTFTRRSVETQIEAFYSFLLNDGIERGRRVVRHLIDLFKSVRAAVADADAPDATALDVFLLVLGDLAHEMSGADRNTLRVSPADDARGVYAELRRGRLTVEMDRFRRAQIGPQVLDLHTALSIRHVGGLLFQEAHFELLRPADLDLLGQARGGKLGPPRAGAHFTPPALARSVVEQALQSVENLSSRRELVLLDPACGSGAFLHEALRALQRAGFAGEVRVIGRDVSRAAVSMARFVLSRALGDWANHLAVLDLQVGDSLAAPLPAADLVVMNPPFVSFAAVSAPQREQMRGILGRAYRGRPDLSMAFVVHALAAVRSGGALGCLFPASLLSLNSASEWRRMLAERAGLRFLASIGDFGLFEYAFVQVAAAVFASGGSDREVLTLWTANDSTATGVALRQLRKSRRGSVLAEESEAWRLGRLSVSRLAARPDWRLRPPRVDRLVAELSEAVPSTVAHLFKVQQGIRTGANEAFLLSDGEWRILPEEERRWFRRAITNASIKDGRLETSEHVFYPYRRGHLVFTSEAEVERALPKYFARHLRPHQPALAMRSMVAEQGAPWWSLTRQRAFDTGGKPRVISKYFGSVGGFAPDLGSDVAVVQGYSWYPTASLARTSQTDEARGIASPGFVAGYAALFNTPVFALLLDAFSAQVAGGQYDLSKRYVDAINLPDLGLLFADAARRSVVVDLEQLGIDIRVGESRWSAAATRAAAAAYGLDFGGFMAP